ncbi:MAG: tetratricopeptide repeat protein [Rhodomicrobiaceae bacterium]
MRRVVFLSSTGKDLHTYRQAVIDHLAKLDHFECDAMEHFGARDASAIPFCRERVRRADIYVGLIGHYRGWEPDGDAARRSITEMEYDWACEPPVKPRLVYVAPEDFPLPGPEAGDGGAERQTAFRARLMSAHIVDQKHFETPEALAASVSRGLTNHVINELLRERARGEQAADGERGDPYAAAADAAEQYAEDENIDPAALTQRGVDVAEIEAKLAERAAAHEAKGHEERRISARYHRQIGALAFLHDTQKALAAYAKATELDPDDPEGWNQLGQLQWRIGDLDAAQRSYERVMALGNQLEDQALIAVATGNLGTIYWTRGDFDQAETMSKKSVAIEEVLGRKKGMAVQYGNLGAFHHTRGDLEQAETMYRKALAIDEALDRKEGMASNYGNLGVLYKTCGDLGQAEAMHKKSLAINKALGRKEGIASDYGNLGILYAIRGDLGQAEAMYKKGLAIEEALRRKGGIANAYGNLGDLYAEKGNIVQACAHWRKARDLFTQIGMKPQLEKVEGSLREAGCPER